MFIPRVYCDELLCRSEEYTECVCVCVYVRVSVSNLCGLETNKNGAAYVRVGL
jgi:hypothetical protein